jgi:hypothetical protein
VFSLTLRRHALQNMGAWVSLITFVGTWLAELLLEEVDPLRAEDGLPATNGSYQGAEAVADPD